MTLLPALTIEETAELLEKAQSGDKTARDKLVEHNLRLIVRIVSKFGYKQSHNNYEDIFQTCVIALLNAIDKFNPSKGLPFSTYAGIVVENGIRIFMRSERKQRHEVDEFTALGNMREFDQDSDSVFDIIEDTKQTEDKWIAEIMAPGMLSMINEREQRILKMYYIEGIRDKEIGELLNMKRSTVCRARGRAIKKIACIINPDKE